MASAYSFSDVTIFYSEKELMNNVFLTISEGDRIGVVGRNGAGKSTFLRLLSGKEEPDHGEISVKRGMSVAYLPQTPVLREDDTITRAALDYLPARQGEDPSSAAYEAQTILTQLGFADLNQPRAGTFRRAEDARGARGRTLPQERRAALRRADQPH